nr:MAG TPA: cysteine-rich protein [Caudoviricetes sp.]
MLKEFNGQTWFCCPRCGKKIHPVKPDARGVYTVCKQKRKDGSRCNWSGEIRWEK